ncbi:MAG: alpha-aminoadipate/glutamate carrier protein LysW/ArgW [Nitrososphaerales archaeon]|nr:alpha-aminoadipate/glutamate carrier protein LysW/ArgW [Nitrososphaerales archaeon]
MKTLCKECSGEIKVPDDVVVGEIITCPDCGSDFEIFSIHKKEIEIKPAETVGEDWGE